MEIGRITLPSIPLRSLTNKPSHKSAGCKIPADKPGTEKESPPIRQFSVPQKHEGEKTDLAAVAYREDILWHRMVNYHNSLITDYAQQPLSRSTPHGRQSNESQVIRESPVSPAVIRFIVGCLTVVIVKMLEHQVVTKANAIEPGMLETFENIEEMNIDEISSVCGRKGIAKELAGTSRNNRKSAEPALLEKIVRITKIDLTFELGIQRTNTIVPSWGADHHVVVGEDEYVALRLI